MNAAAKILGLLRGTLGPDAGYDRTMGWRVWSSGCPRCDGPIHLHDEGIVTCAGACEGDLKGELLPAIATPQALRKSSALVSPAPVAGAPLEALTAWIAAQLRLPAPVARVTRWGSSAVAPVQITLADGRRIRFAEATHIADGGRLVQTVVLALGADAPQLPLFTRADAQDVFSAVIRACQVTEVDDEATRTRDWLDGLLGLSREMHHGAYEDPAARWAGLSWLRRERVFDPKARHLAEVDETYRIPIIVWSGGSRYVRVLDVERYIRGVVGEHLASQQIIPRLREIGCEHRIADMWRPRFPRTNPSENRCRFGVLVLPREGDDHGEQPLTRTSPVLSQRVPTLVHTKIGPGQSGATTTSLANTDLSEIRDSEEVRVNAGEVVA